MKLRAPAYPLITVDPYFSVWSTSNSLNKSVTAHWTGSSNTMDGIVYVDGKPFRFMGKGKEELIRQTNVDINAFSTAYTFENELIKLNIFFFTPVFAEDLYYASRPVSYMTVSYEADGKHEVRIGVSVSEEICMNKKGDDKTETGIHALPNGLKAVSIGTKSQKMLTRSGDDLRTEWGYFYLSAPEKAEYSVCEADEMTFVKAEFALEKGKKSTVLFAYDDIYSIGYFGKKLKAYWHTKGISILEAMAEAEKESEEIFDRCEKYSAELFAKAEKAGGRKYAELLSLAYRQVMNAHKIAVKENGEVVFISKECFSNGCAATVDVTYPSAPMFLLLNTELLKGMLRPVFDFAESEDWVYDFAPHDAGQYPLIDRQRYGLKRGRKTRYKLKSQMPVEESGNMLVLVANICIREGNTEFADKYMNHLESWVKYLIKYGKDPRNQLCTDDFAGHLAHNCNLSIKAIMGIAGFSKILSMKGETEKAAEYFEIAKKMAKSWKRRASNGDGSYRLAFDREGTFSMKYNMIWDKFWGTGLFEDELYASEFASNLTRINKFGMPLDNRRTYTKSDWLVWTACLAPSKRDFEKFIAPLWDAYNKMKTRVPMTDWYDTVTADKVGFQNRTVQGGLFIKLLENDFKW